MTSDDIPPPPPGGGGIFQKIDPGKKTRRLMVGTKTRPSSNYIIPLLAIRQYLFITQVFHFYFPPFVYIVLF
jgi:hypothetical protein